MTGARSKRQCHFSPAARAFVITRVVLCLSVLGFLAGCDRGVAVPQRLPFKIVSRIPHDPKAFTQGLIVAPPYFYESTGKYGKSSLRRVEMETGRIVDRRSLPDHLFGEGLTLLDGKLYQLEWKSGTGMVYDPYSLNRIGGFRYDGEGWGLTTDGRHLIISDGSSRLRFLDPDDWSVSRELKVRDHRGEVVMLNELEYIEGKIFANIWGRDRIVRIDPKTGEVDATLEIDILERPRPADEAAVANGIAFDPESGLLYVTGKFWKNIYVLRMVHES